MKLPITKTIAGAAGLASVAWVSIMAAIVARQTSIIFNPVTEREVEHPQSDGHRTRHIVLRTADGERLCGWLMTPHAPGKHPGVLYFGGRSEEVSWVARDAGRMFPGMTVLAMNYRGYGGSSGTPGERELLADAEMLWQWLAAYYRVDAERIAVVGRSLGSGVAVQVAAQHPVTSLVLVTPYDSLVSLARRRFRTMPVHWWMRHRFESVKFAARLQTRTLVLRAEEDDIVPAAHTDAFVAGLPVAPLEQTIAGSDHCSIPYLEASQQAIAGFLQAGFQRLPVTTPLLEEATAVAAVSAVASASATAAAAAEGSASAIAGAQAVTDAAALATAAAAARAAAAAGVELPRAS
ncbi:MAG: alpha/beta hydrolase [Paucimonas sp.]|nr:alpha/beta hydrolase [Paucimonas sp.]